MVTWSGLGLGRGPGPASQATPAKPPLSSSTVALMSIEPLSSTPLRRVAPPAHSAAAAPPVLRARAGPRGGARGGDARLHVARAAPVDPSLADDAAEGIDGPAGAGGDDVEV